MKELKFRAFHKPSKKMFDVGMIDFLSEKLYEYISLGMSSFDGMEMYDLQDCELMQFTGLKDVDGKEIFGGDVVEIKFDDYYSNNSFTIDEDSTHKGEIVFEFFGYYIKFPDMCFMSINDIADYEFNIKILGNIHQNPELLEKK